jgi:hypothetical protein
MTAWRNDTSCRSLIVPFFLSCVAWHFEHRSLFIGSTMPGEQRRLFKAPFSLIHLCVGRRANFGAVLALPSSCFLISMGGALFIRFSCWNRGVVCCPCLVILFDPLDLPHSTVFAVQLLWHRCAFNYLPYSRRVSPFCFCFG